MYKICLFGNNRALRTPLIKIKATDFKISKIVIFVLGKIHKVVIYAFFSDQAKLGAGF